MSRSSHLRSLRSFVRRTCLCSVFLLLGMSGVFAQDRGPHAPAGPVITVRPHQPPPAGYTAIEQDGWAWAIPRGSEPPHERLTALIDDRLAQIRARLGRPGNIEPLIVRTPDPRSMRQVTVGFGGGTPEKWVAALAFPARGIVVLEAQRLAQQPLQRGEIIAHELAHVVLGESGPNIPRWYHEGVAQWLAGERLEAEWIRLLARFANDEGLYRFAELTSFPPESQRESSIFYAQAHLFVLHLNDRFGSPVHARLLDQLAAGSSFDAAFLEAAGVSLTEVEEAWRVALAREHSWWSVGGGLTFFQVLAVLAVFAFLVQRARRLRMLARMTELEAGEEPDPRSYGGLPPSAGGVNTPPREGG